MWLLLFAAWASDPPTYMGRTIAVTMDAAGAPWLVRDTRQQEEDAETLLRKLAVKPGQVVCDVGAGNGYHSLPLAKAVAPKGRVIATDIQQGMLDALAVRVESAGIDNIEPVLATVDDPRLPKDTCDLVLLVDVYHEFSDPEAMLAGIRASLTETGRVALVEYRAEDPKVPMKPLHKMTAVQCDAEFAANGLQPKGRFDGLPWQHLLFYGRP